MLYNGLHSYFPLERHPMIDRSLLKFRLAVLFSLCLSAVAVPCCLSQAAKQVVKSQADLPRFNYPIAGTAGELLQSDDATFNVFAAKVKSDVDSVLSGYDIQDHAALRSLLGVELNLQVLSGNDKRGPRNHRQTTRPAGQAGCETAHGASASGHDRSREGDRPEFGRGL